MSPATAKTSAAILIALVTAGCAHDRILPVDSVCGDGKVTGDEQCDVDSPGCVDCRIVSGWQCPNDVCTGICGDGKLEGDEECDPPNGVTCDSTCKAAAGTTGCDLGGYFAVHQTNYSRDTIVQAVQTSSNWYFYHFTQSGTVVTVDQALTCGIEVTGTVTVTLDDDGLKSLLYSNSQVASGAHGARHGSFVQNGDSCELSLDRWYLVRGAEESFLPADFSKDPALADLVPLPTAADTTGATDPEGNGTLGLSLHLTGNIPGIRNVAQRDWNEYSPDPATPVPTGSIEFSAVSTFDNQESVLSVEDCAPSLCPLLEAGSTPALDLPGHVDFLFLGKELSDPRVSAIAAAAPGGDVETDMTTCANVRAAEPHQPYVPSP